MKVLNDQDKTDDEVTQDDGELNNITIPKSTTPAVNINDVRNYLLCF